MLDSMRKRQGYSFRESFGDLQAVVAAGGGAGTPLTATGIRTTDHIVAAFSVPTAGGAFESLTATASIPSDDNVQFVGATTSDTILVLYMKQR